MKLEVYHQIFLKVIDTLIHVDESLAFWPFEEANTLESTLLKTRTALGSSINQIIKFFDSFWVSKTFSLAYVNCLIGFNMDIDAFMHSASSMLTDIPAKIFKWTLQVPHITTLSWIFGTHENFAIKDFEQLLQDAATHLAPNQFPPVQYGLNFKPIWDGSSKAERDKDKSHNKWAIHVDAIAEIASTSKALLKKALASSWIHSYTNLPLLLVPVLTKKTPNSEADDIKRAIARHCTVIQSMSKSFSSKILSLDRPLSALANATLRTTIMAITNSAGKKLFLSVDHNWNGQGFIFTYPTLYASQASDYVEYLPVYLAHSHSDEVFRWFSPDAVAEAQAMGWDDEKKQPISKDGLDLRTSIQSLDLEWCIAPPSSSPQTASALDLDNITLPSFNTAPKPVTVQPGLSSVAPNSIPASAQSTLADHPDDITMASTVDTRLSALERTCALLPAILQKLEALSPPPTINTVSGSTSIQTVTTTPSAHGSASGGRD